MSDLAALQQRAKEVRDRYAELNKQQGQGVWTGREFMMGFVGDVGDLTKLVMAKEGLRSSDDVDAKLAHELSDCLWSVLVLAGHYGIDLEKAFTKTMNELDERIARAHEN